MRIKLIVSASLGLLITPGYAQEKTLSKQELLEQLAVKEDQLTVLGKKIIDQEASICSLQQRFIELVNLLKEAQRQKFLEENPCQKINQDALDKAYRDELTLFFEGFIDVRNKKEQLIIESSFFKEFLKESDALFFRFYITKVFYDKVCLEKMIAAWENLSDTIIELYNKLNMVKE